MGEESAKLYWKQHHVIGDRFVYVAWYGARPKDYLILPNGDNYCLDSNGKTLGIFNDADDAKAAAQSRFEYE